MRLNFSSARFVRYYGHKTIIDSLTNLKTISELKSKLIYDTQTKYSLILFNIDNFCRINNAYGFEVGDEVLKQTALMLGQITKCCGDLYHLMGDEFVALIDANQDPIEIAKSALALCNNAAINLDVIELRITLSAGIATGCGTDLLKHAKIAIMDARENGKGRIQLYRQGCLIEQQIEHNFKWQNRLKEAFENNKFMPYFQPIENLHNGKIEKYECLIRMNERFGVTEPLVFLGAAKECGLLSVITRTILAQSFIFFQDNSYAFSVNITEDDLQDDAFLPFVKHKLQLYNIEPSRVYFEILEGIGSNIVSESLETLRGLKALGCKLVVDDFGVGHSNFHRMLELDIDIIKIDGSFIKNLDESVTSRKIVSAIVGFARAIDAKVVAEYVKSKAIYDIVKEMGIDYAQGYFIGAPNAQLI
ncbi:MAG: hypothetical protein RL154_638 [Pseudomonadota bacterium]|jgi:diguanylate cyclase (GGDEF)-like protein